MRAMEWGVSALACVLVATAVAAQQPAQPRPPLVKENATIKVSDHVYLIPDDDVPVVSNIGIVVGNRATLVVDTGLGTRNGQTILREVAKVSKNADLYFVATHFHPEHAGGTGAFPATAKFIVSKIQQQDLDEFAHDWAIKFSGFGPVHGELLKGVTFRRADILFERRYDLDLGGVSVRLLSLGPTHTRGDTMAFVGGDDVLLAGDVVLNRAFLGFQDYSSAQAWLSILNELATLRPRTVVPSHGAMGDASLIDQQREVLEHLHARVRELNAQGHSVEAISKLLIAEFQARNPDWTGPNRVGNAVRSAYLEMR